MRMRLNAGNGTLYDDMRLQMLHLYGVELRHSEGFTFSGDWMDYSLYS